MSPPLLSRRNGAHRTPARAPCPTRSDGCGRMRFLPTFPKEDFMRAARPTFGAFNQGGVPTIACFNKASTPLGVDFDALIAAMQAFVDRCVPHTGEAGEVQGIRKARGRWFSSTMPINPARSLIT